ncbi:signal peptidase I [Georgenia sp. TF02-10]|uniref:signal peptidase I n=1 Tax=Georgenia sp. TF02-10 TaxID=2917725 RepID=UPI001FA7B3B4|nr:signal peptidase I [Georgenia sp. TF02-10]UNX55354.1 signal peptidase I [Georgenia sp. TF02-10]
MIRRLGRAVLVLLLALVAALALAMVIVPRVMGWVPLTILSGSMEPTIPTGSQVVVAPVEGADGAAGVQVGDVITVMPYPDDDTLVTHRVVARTEAADGAVALTTQGDANASADPWTVTGTQLRGVVRYHVPYAGYLATALDGHQKQMGTVVVAVALLGYAAVQVLAAVRGARAGERPAAGGRHRAAMSPDGERRPVGDEQEPDARQAAQVEPADAAQELEARQAADVEPADGERQSAGGDQEPDVRQGLGVQQTAAGDQADGAHVSGDGSRRTPGAGTAPEDDAEEPQPDTGRAPAGPGGVRVPELAGRP